MSSFVVLLEVFLVLAALLAVVQPLLRGIRSYEDETDSSELGLLLETRDRALAAIRELEFDRQAGRISEADYRDLAAALRREAALALARTKHH